MFDSALGVWVILGPQAYELVQMVCAQNGPIPSQIVEVVHDDRHKQVDDEKRAERVERDEVKIGHVRTANFVRVVHDRVAFGVLGRAVEHDLLIQFKAIRFLMVGPKKRGRLSLDFNDLLQS